MAVCLGDVLDGAAWQRRAHHHADRAGIEVGGWMCRGEPAAGQHRDPVRDLKELIEVFRSATGG
jgi:hypothetical protein